MENNKNPRKGYGMSTLPWIKLHLDLLREVRFGQLPESARLRYIELMLLAGECDAEGYLRAGEYELTCGDLAWRLRLPLEKIKADVDTLLGAGLLEIDEGSYLLPDFSERQGRMLSEKRANDRQRQARSRLRKRTAKALEHFTAVFKCSPSEQQAGKMAALIRRYGLSKVKAALDWAQENGYRPDEVEDVIESSPPLLSMRAQMPGDSGVSTD
jgi:hypothetical protein